MKQMTQIGKSLNREQMKKLKGGWSLADTCENVEHFPGNDVHCANGACFVCDCNDGVDICIAAGSTFTFCG